MSNINRGEVTRKKILKVAKRLIAKKGFASTTVDDIASAAKVNIAVLYYYFEDKDSILQNVIQESLITFKKKFLRMNKEHLVAIYQQKGKDHTQRVRIILTELLDFACKSQPFAKIVLEQTLLHNAENRSSFFSFYSELCNLKPFESRKNIDLKLYLFFYHIFPVLNFAVFYKKLAKDFGINTEEIKNKFIEVHAPFYLESLYKIMDFAEDIPVLKDLDPAFRRKRS